MGVKSSYLIKRDTAIDFINDRLNGLNGRVLGDIVDLIVNNELMGFEAVTEEKFEANKEKKYQDLYLENI